jgi:F-type H+-transporting ATPase subunit b
MGIGAVGFSRKRSYVDFSLIAHAAETAHTATESAQGISALGVDWRSLLFQVINFSILLFLLNKYAFPPIIRVLESRREKIEESLRTAEVIEAQHRELKETQAKLIKETQAQSHELITASKEQANDLLKESERKAKERAEHIMQETEALIRHEADELRNQLKSETARLVAAATEKILRQKLDAPRDTALIESTLKSLNPKEPV